jgi:crotonobetainyl-CoA:carnitine CoA-transferase CaiB-like acyl-CoA transferase
MTSDEPGAGAEDVSADGPLKGITVVEMASWVMVPACGAILSAYGADVIKVEPAGSADPARYGRREVDGEPVEPGFELVNNRKRSVQLDLSTAAGQEVMHRLLERADVFISNVRAKSLERSGIDPDALHARYPELVIAHGSGYGPEGADSDRPAFDELAYWSRGGIGHALMTDDDPPVQLQGAMGDMPSGVHMVAGVMMALFRRERGEGGSIVDVSLYASGIWANGWLLQDVLLGGPEPSARGRRYRLNPLYTNYQCSDGSWIQFAMFQTDRYWPPVCEVVGRPELIDDERFATHADRIANSHAAVLELQEAIRRMKLEEIGPLLDERDLPWSPIFSLTDIANDEQARVNGYIVSKQHRSGVAIDVLAPPFSLRDVDIEMGPAPEVGQHLEEALLEVGYSWDDIDRLRNEGAF